MAPTQKLVYHACQQYQQQKLDDMHKTCATILEQDPDNLDALRLLTVTAREQGDLQRAIEIADNAVHVAQRLAKPLLASCPGLNARAVLLFELAAAYRAAGRDEETLAALRRSVQLQPLLQESLVNLAGLLENLNRADEAFPYALKAVEIKPSCSTAHYNLANILRLQRRFDSAISNYRRCLRLNPTYAKAYMNLAVCLLLRGEFAEGWRAYEWRGEAGEVSFDAWPQPRWDGTPVLDQTVVIHAEQGIGDEIMFASCYSEALQRVGRCVLVCEPRLEKLFARSFPEAKVVGYLRRKDWQPAPLDEVAHLQIPAGSLPNLFRPNRESFPNRDKFLTPDPIAVDMWKQRFEALGPGLKIGISWRAGGKPSEQQRRTTSLLQWQDILTQSGAHFVNLQYGDCIDDLAEVRDKLGIVVHDFDDGDPLVDMDAFAAKVAALDLVVSVGNATVHMAGSIGTPAWAILPIVPGWRWMLTGEDSPWYSSVRIFRQHENEDWSPVLQRVASKLQSEFNLKRSFSSGQIHSSTPAAASPDSTTEFRHVRSSIHWSQQQITDVFNKGLALHKAGNVVEAERIYRDILKHAPRHADSLHLLGVVGQQTGRLDLAVSSIRRALCVASHSAVMHFNLGVSLQGKRLWDEAADSFRTAALLDPNMGDAHGNLGLCLETLGRFAEAAAALAVGVQLMPDQVLYHLHLARCLRKTCRIDGAIEHYRLATELQPDLLKARLELASTLLEDGLAEDAKTSLREALRLSPENSSAYLLLGKAYMAQEKFADALKYLLRSADLNASCYDVFLEMARCLERMGKRSEALRCLQQGLQLQPAHPGCTQLLARLEGRAVVTDPAGALLRPPHHVVHTGVTFGAQITPAAKLLGPV